MSPQAIAKRGLIEHLKGLGWLGLFLLPKPKHIVRGSVSGSFPSLAKKRSGLNCEGLAYVRGSLSIDLSQLRAFYSVHRAEGSTNQMLGNTKDPFGIKYPSWISFSATQW